MFVFSNKHSYYISFDIYGGDYPTAAIYGTCANFVHVYFELWFINHLPLHVAMVVQSAIYQHIIEGRHFPAFQLEVLARTRFTLLSTSKAAAMGGRAPGSCRLFHQPTSSFLW